MNVIWWAVEVCQVLGVRSQETGVRSHDSGFRF